MVVRRVCMVMRGHVWLHGEHVWLWGACMVVGGMHGCRGGAWDMMRYGQ